MNLQTHPGAGAPAGESAARVVAPGTGNGRALLGAGIVVVWNDVAPEGREQFYEWHDKEHIPERLALPGFRRGRRYVLPGHSPEWLTLYEADDLGVMVSLEYLARLNAPTPATTATLAYFRNTSRAVCRVDYSSGSSSGGYLLTLRLDGAADGVAQTGAESLRALLTNEVLPRAQALTGVLACHLCIADQSASFINTAESSTRRFDVPAWVLLVEASSAEAAARARAVIAAADLARHGVSVRNDAAIYALEVSRLAGPAAA